MACAPVRRDNPRDLERDYRPYRRTNHAYLTCTTISSVELAQYGVSLTKDWVMWNVVHVVVVSNADSPKSQRNESIATPPDTEYVESREQIITSN